MITLSPSTGAGISASDADASAEEAFAAEASSVVALSTLASVTASVAVSVASVVAADEPQPVSAPTNKAPVTANANNFFLLMYLFLREPFSRPFIYFFLWVT